jgi:ABC-type Fe3+-hydroxamate transport system substrate-binding protein
MPTYTDQMGNDVYLEEIPQRIVSLVPSQTELLFDLGLDETVVGLTRFCVHPDPKVKGRTSIGGTKNPDLDKIRELKPDLIIGNREENRREDIEALQKEYPVWMSDVTTLGDATGMIREVGGIVGKEASAQWIANLIEARFNDLTRELPTFGPPKRVVYLIWRKPWMVAGSGTFIHTMLQLAGFTNIFGNSSRYPECSEKELITARPDLVFLSSEPFSFGDKHLEELRELCPSAQVRLVRGDLFSWYGSRLLRTPQYLRLLRASALSGVKL